MTGQRKAPLNMRSQVSSHFRAIIYPRWPGKLGFYTDLLSVFLLLRLVLQSNQIKRTLQDSISELII